MMDRVHPVSSAIWEFKGTKLENIAKEKIAEILVKRLQIDRSEAIRLIDPEKQLKSLSQWPDSNEVVKEMADDFRKWKKLLGKENSEQLGPRVAGQATRIYTLPEKSDV
jgi:hypothetical protein